ncbi:MAG: flagellin, partial [Campylobacteraceae bacterium]|nr:flagellin [Campylobacteraceae bacterium]MDY4121194.1 flagellin [Campylobacter sp.]
AKMVETDDLSFKEINDMLTILASGDLDKMNGRGEKIDGTATQDELNAAYAAFEETFLQASVSVESTMNHRGLVTVKDKTTSVTGIKIAMYQDHGDKDYPDAVGTENTKSASVLSFNKNDAVTIDRPSIDLFADLDDMIEAVFNGDFYGNAKGVNPRTSGVQGAIKRLDHIMDHVHKIHAIAGTNSRHITDTNERATTLYLNVAEVKSTVIDADYGELAMQFQNNLLAYQAMLQASAKINQISLLNYM